MRLILKPGASCSTVYAPQGRATVRCSAPRVVAARRSSPTTSLTRCRWSRCATSVASGVSTITRSSTPTVATTRSSAWIIRVARVDRDALALAAVALARRRRRGRRPPATSRRRSSRTRRAPRRDAGAPSPSPRSRSRCPASRRTRRVDLEHRVARRVAGSAVAARGARAVEHRRRVRVERREDRARREAEHARVPQVAAATQRSARRRRAAASR